VQALRIVEALDETEDRDARPTCERMRRRASGPHSSVARKRSRGALS
jgi:hypothetical protein